MFRSFERSLRRQEDKERTVVLVDIGSRFTTVVFGRGLEISFVKQIPIGGENLNQEVASKLGVDIEEAESLRGKLRMEDVVKAHQHALEGVTSSVEQSRRAAILQSSQSMAPLDGTTRQAIVDAIEVVGEELAREISLCFRYYTVTFRGNRVEDVIFAGGGAYEEVLLDFLKQQLGVKIEVAHPLRGLDLSNRKVRVSFEDGEQISLCEWAVAVGLSLKGWNPDLVDDESVVYERN